MKKNIALVGMRCSGKTKLGKKIASNLGWDFVDTDDLVEKKAGKKISEIVAESGWDCFRDMENEACEGVANKENTIISLGGGAITFPRNREIFKNSFVVYLRVPIGEICTRIKNKEDRPSLSGKLPHEEAREIYAQRKEVYKQSADLIVSLRHINPNKNAKKLLTEIKKSLKIFSF